MKAGVIVFPGSNCDRDVETVLSANGFDAVRCWHGESALPDDLKLIVLPGGFSYGDYLRCGAMAAQSPIMQSVRQFAESGGHVLGICNGFQMLCETGLLPGTLMQNNSLKFICKSVNIRVEDTTSPYTSAYSKGEVAEIPVAHHEGNYFVDDATLKQLEDNDQIAFRYCDAEGNLDDAANPNGSRGHIAGVFNVRKNILGMMPHPERHAETALGGADGKGLFESIRKQLH